MKDAFPFQLLESLRPQQWVKNFACFAGILFSGKLRDPDSQIAFILLYRDPLLWLGIVSWVALVVFVVYLQPDLQLFTSSVPHQKP